MRTGFIRWTITILAVTAAVAHAYLPELTLDGITVTLLAIAALPWLAPLFRSVELPGGVKVEFQDLEAAKKKVEEAGLVSPIKVGAAPKRHVYAFEAVAGNDPNLALAGLRIEIESRLREIAKSRQIPEDKKSVRQLTRDLMERDVLGREEVSAIDDLLPLLNRAAHGATVDDRASQWALDFGPRLLSALEERLGETSIPRLLERWRARDGAAVAEIGTELSKALAQTPQAFLKGMRNDPESFSAWLDGLEHHTFTIFESRGELEDDLYGAYYAKLKELMEEAIKPLVGKEFDEEAKRVLDAVKRAQIRRIW